MEGEADTVKKSIVTSSKGFEVVIDIVVICSGVTLCGVYRCSYSGTQR